MKVEGDMEDVSRQLTGKNPKMTHEPRQTLNISRTQGSVKLTAVMPTEHRGSAHLLQPDNTRAQRDRNPYLLLEEIQNAMCLGKHVDDFLQTCTQQGNSEPHLWTFML